MPLQIDASSVFHIFAVIVKEREKFMEYLYNKGIETKIHYPIPPHKQIAYRSLNKNSHHITDLIHQEIVSIPANISLSLNELDKIVEVINEY